jgi:hypothetical protein
MKPWNCAHLIFEKAPKIHEGEKTASSTNVAEKTGYLHVENWTRSLSFTLCKCQLKMG